ncbi:MAG: saccharopine dehydrogenase C-terminal domain-containing protein [Ginsengibacter sp.]
MKSILLFGAGKSATCLIDYLNKCCDQNDWNMLVCDADLSLAQSKIKDFSSSLALAVDVSDAEKRAELISEADMVISMLPAALHFLVATDCVRLSKNLLTASYLDDNIRSLKSEIEEKGLLFLGEMGLDPGIDHMSAMKLINKVKKDGGEIYSFKSHCGGLVSPESDDNPWHYKITWNPANVVMAGSSGAVYIDNGETVRLPYSKIFDDDNNSVDVPGLFPLAWYANRDSLPYVETYQLQEVKTFIRTTLRYPAFCRGWNKLIKLGLTEKDDQQQIQQCHTYSDWFNLKKKALFSENIDKLNEEAFFNEEFTEQLDFIWLRNEENIPSGFTNSAALLQHCLEEFLVMNHHDKDMIIMMHEVEYSIDGRNKKIRTSLIVEGEDAVHTAMSKTVGLPLGIAAKLILEDKIKLTGLHIPVIEEIYEPVLRELELNDIRFNEELIDL